MTETVLASVKVAPETVELRELPMPDVPDDGAIMRVDAAGVCGSDPHAYRVSQPPCILGHENAGTIHQIGPAAAKRWGLAEGDRVVVEEYLPCWHCDHCYAGDFRLCAAGKMGRSDVMRYGFTGIHVAPGLWGGFSRYVYLPWNAVIHRLPDRVSASLASLAVPVSNGIEWACKDGGAGPGRDVLVIGPGQQGLGCVVAARRYGAERIIIAGMTRDRRRLEAAPLVGADVAVNVEEEDLVERVMEVTGGKGVEVVVDTTGDSTGRVARDALTVAATDRKATLMFPGTCPIEFPFDELKRKYAIVKAYRGHSYQSVEQAIDYLGSDRHPLGELCTHEFGLADVDLAIKATGGAEVGDAIHVTVDPWK